LSVTGHLGDVARDLWRDRDLPGGDEGVVGVLEVFGVFPVKVTSARYCNGQREANDRGKWVPPQEPARLATVVSLFRRRKLIIVERRRIDDTGFA
jgi:hypothetical protein